MEIPTDELSVISDAGEVRIIELTPAVTVRVLDRELATEVGRYLDLVCSSREQDLRRIDHGARDDVDRGDDPLHFGPEGVLHLHGLDHREGIADSDVPAYPDPHVENLARHRGDD